MTLATVAVDEAVTATLMNQLVANVNTSPGIAIFVANGTWSVPNGVHKFKVTMCGGGGSAGILGYLDGPPGGEGGDSIMRTIWVSGADLGASYSITIGAGGTTGAGSSSSFGTLLTVGGGGKGASDSTVVYLPGTKGSPGAPTGSMSGSAMAVGNDRIIYDTPYNIPRGYGKGGLRTDDHGAPGIVIIEW